MIGKPCIDGYYRPISKEKAAELASIFIEECNFSARSFNVLKRAGIDNLLSLAVLTEEDLLSLKGCGNGSFIEIKSCLKEHGISIIPVCVFENEEEKNGKKIIKTSEHTIQSFAETLEFLKTVTVDDAELSVRAHNCLVRRQIKTLYDFAVLSLDEAMNIPQLGKNTLKEIIAVLKKYGLDYPVDGIDLSELGTPLTSIDLSKETLSLLDKSGFMFVDDLKKLSDEQLYRLLSGFQRTDSLTIIYSLSAIKDIGLNSDFFDSYLHYAIERIVEHINDIDRTILTLAFGLFGEKVWPSSVLSSSLLLEEEQIEKQINRIVSAHFVQNNYSRVKPLIRYYLDNHEVVGKEDECLLLLKRIIEIMSAAFGS